MKRQASFRAPSFRQHSPQRVGDDKNPLTTDVKLDPETAWRQLLARDRSADFFYGVTTTGVFCRPGCVSRPPLRDNVRYFLTPAEALAAGFRPCRRCRPTAVRGNPLDVIRACIEQNLDRRVPLAELARVAGLSSFTVQRLFQREMGVSPLQYQRALRAATLRERLKGKESVTDAIYNAGFSSPSRAYDAAQLGMTPARFARGGEGEEIGFCTATSPFGWMIAGATARGLCWLALAGSKAEAEDSLRTEFPAATLRRDPSLGKWLNAAVESVRPCSAVDCCSEPLLDRSLDLRGTVFQLRVWRALRQIPRGQTRTYGQLAAELGQPNATRAVARACAMNRVALLVPCHRVIGASGSLTGYRWGMERKRKILEAEDSSR